MTNPKMSPWHVTTDPRMLRRMGKTTEEASELLAVCGRIVIQGIDEIDPSSGKTNRQRFIEEAADTYAQLDLTLKYLGASFPLVLDRVEKKKQQMADWESQV